MGFIVQLMTTTRGTAFIAWSPYLKSEIWAWIDLVSFVT